MIEDRSGSKKAIRRQQSAQMSVTDTARRMFRLMSREERARMWWLTPVVTVNGLFQVLGIASVMPFLALIANPQVVQEQALLAWIYVTLGFESTLGFTIFAGIMVLVLLLMSNAVAALTQYLTLRFSWSLNHTMSVRMLRTYLTKPYVFFLDRNTSELSKNILGEVKHAVKHFVVAGIDLIARSIVALSIMVLLIAIDPLLALATVGFLGAAYGAVFLLIQRRMADSGSVRAASDAGRFKAAAEALTGVKEIKLLGLEGVFVGRYEEPSRVYTRAIARQEVVATLPRYAFETIAFGGMLVIVLYLLGRGQGITALLPTLGAYAFAAYRILPALQGIFSSLTQLRFALASVDVLHHDLERSGPATIPNRSDHAPLPFRSSLALRDVTFTYPNTSRPLFASFDLDIQPNTTVAVVGTTGAGKSTLVDIILGLLRPASGALVVDGMVVDDERLPAWQQSLGYVPQEIYLVDATITANIAFGVPATEVDMEAVVRAATRANIHDFILKELPNGYATEIGERGVRLSGGQRQRLGIARALYHDPSVLILDEATSALDNVTEEHIFNAVSDLGTTKTIVMIAHRISTVRDCDVIHVLDHGRIVASGSYDELIVSSAAFRALARVDAPHAADVDT